MQLILFNLSESAVKSIQFLHPTHQYFNFAAVSSRFGLLLFLTRQKGLCHLAEMEQLLYPAQFALFES